ncbi:MAG: Na+/H+ antiporter NhaA [Bacteroidetes bacterium]|nr:Na+/H+ antiporter NhaA [Bacteroidota bacterium]
MSVVQKTTSTISDFIRKETNSGVVLIVCALGALIIANSTLKGLYSEILNYTVGLSLLHWINDGLMAIFFFLVGLEIKREITIGELSSRQKAILPVVAAVGGMIVPALLYLSFNQGTEAAVGWGIPMATDIAFSLGVLALLGKSVPVGLKVFLTAFAIADDLGAVLVIAFFYTSKLSYISLVLGGLLFSILVTLSMKKCNSGILYGVLSIALWGAFLKSGVHATVAGVLAALTIPVHSTNNSKSLLVRWEHALQPYVAFGIMPIFAFANSGVTIEGDITNAFTHPVTLGIIAGLVLGKTVGIFVFSRVATILQMATLPSGVTWKQIAGTSMLGGIGFTMSLFIATLAFPDSKLLTFAKIGILSGSLIAGILGYLYLKITATTSSQNSKLRY